MDSENDPKTRVTPYAFKIADDVMNTPLASPWRRGFAIAIDGLLISVLAEQAGILFVLLVGLALLIQRRSHLWGKWSKWAIYLLMLMIVVAGTVSNLFDPQSQVDVGDNEVSLYEAATVVRFVPNIIELENCDTRQCAAEKLQTLDDLVAKADVMNAEQRRAFYLQLIDELTFSDAEKATLAKIVDVELTASALINDASTAPLSTFDRSAETVDVSTSVAATDLDVAQQKPKIITAQGELSDIEKGSPYSLIEWTKGILNDLGLGFGWAAFYFTVFTAWFDGQTLGKKLMFIRVIQLDGKKISLWGAFGRYGGYGAGFATGLLGFVQIFWDANRQAIQDKISATVVIDLVKYRHEQREPVTTVTNNELSGEQ